MICLDTNYLILGLVSGSAEAEQLLNWSDAGRRFCVPSIVWYEFCCGPVETIHIATMRNLIAELIPLEADIAGQAARLFNATGRSRRLRVDAMIAATAISRQVPLATNNHDDFQPFVVHGLQLHRR